MGITDIPTPVNQLVYKALERSQLTDSGGMKIAINKVLGAV